MFESQMSRFTCTDFTKQLQDALAAMPNLKTEAVAKYKDRVDCSLGWKQARHTIQPTDSLMHNTTMIQFLV